MESNRIRNLMRLRDKLESTIIVTGQMILCPDTKELFFDQSESERVQITDVIWLDTDAERLSITPIDKKIYIIKETFHIWSYSDNNWIDLTNKADTSSLIEEGVYTPVTSDAVFQALKLKANNSIGKEIIISVDDWDDNNLAKITVEGITENNNVIVSPKITQDEDYTELYSDSNIKCIIQENQSLTFQCESKPTEAVKVSIIILG